MADAVATLVKLAEQKVEEKQKELAVLNGNLNAMQAREEELNTSISSGYQQAEQANDPTISQQAGNYAKRAEIELDVLKQAFELVEKERDEKFKALQGLFAEQKRYEILLERKQKEALKKREKKQQDQLDELAGNRR